MAQDKSFAAAQPTPEESRERAERLASLISRSQRVWAESLDHQIGDVGKMNPDPLHTGPAMARFAFDYWNHPQRVAEATMKLWASQADLWTRMMTGGLGGDGKPVIAPERGDKRFKNEIWSEHPFYDYLKQSYLLTGHWLKERLEQAEGLSPRDRKKLELLTRNFVEAASPTNVPALNPEVMKTTFEEGGENLVRGLENLLRDMERGGGTLKIRQTDLDAFKVGENVATTPGKVIYQNEVMQLIQYAPTTEQVHSRPLLIIPPWINKFYILDLNEKKSLIRWLVGKGHTVFVISWVNPDEKQAGETWESYMKKGALTALEKALEETGADKVNLVGYCIGGTLLGTLLAWMAAKGDKRVASATFFTAQLDFTDAGDLQAFVDDEVLEHLESVISERGYLEAENMFNAFNSLRSTDLIWGFVINNYLLGKENFPFDLLYWNSDSTCMPGRLHLFYLDRFYHRNALAKGEMEIDGVTLDLSKVTVPSYSVATVEDHIAPAASAYRGARLLGGRNRTFILTGSGHIAGVVNPPDANKYQYWTGPGMTPETLEEWQAQAKETPGSWWGDWNEWLAKRSPKKVEAREPGAKLGVIEDAPGSYVKKIADAKN